jgi:hypothetical protein
MASARDRLGGQALGDGQVMLDRVGCAQDRQDLADRGMGGEGEFGGVKRAVGSG